MNIAANAPATGWVAAAYDRLHAAIAEHCEAMTLTAT
jgi:hypothetical protein